MTRDEWLVSHDPSAMLAAWSGNTSTLTVHKFSRKLRLFACACCRQVWHMLTDSRSRKAVEVAERFADGEAAAEAMSSARQLALAIQHGEERRQTMSDENRHAAKMAVDCCSILAPSAARQIAEGYKQTMAARRASQASLLRDTVGNPWEPTPTLAPEWLTPAVVGIARQAYEERPGDGGALDALTLNVLADALTDAGCDPYGLICWSLRGRDRLGWYIEDRPRYRGFWAVDLLLGKS